jgi:peptidoglycan hydrolase CwlO-like protein
MLKRLKRLSGLILLVFSAVGILFCLSALVAVLLQRPHIISGAEDTNQIVLSSLKTANEGLITTQDTLSQSKSVLLATRSSLRQLDGTITELNPALETTQKIIDEDLRAVLEATQVSLVTAEESAQNVDKLLYALDSISFLTGVTYDPDQTLAAGIAGISEDLEPVPISFGELAEEISSTGQNLSLLSAEINKIEKSLGNLDRVLDDVETAAEKIQLGISRLESNLNDFDDHIPKLLNRLTAAMVILLIWMAAVQFGLFFQGAEMAGLSFGNEVQENTKSSTGSHPSVKKEDSTNKSKS